MMTRGESMYISIIAAVASNNAIGRNNQLPWPHCAEDMQFFREHTLNRAIIMGYRTFLSLNSNPLPNRHNIVLNSNVTDVTSVKPGLVFVGSCEQAIRQAQQYCVNNNQQEIMVIGGGRVYEQFLPLADRLYITHFDCAPEGADVFFPNFKTYAWSAQELQSGVGSNGIKYRMVQYDKVQ